MFVKRFLLEWWSSGPGLSGRATDCTLIIEQYLFNNWGWENKQELFVWGGGNGMSGRANGDDNGILAWDYIGASAVSLRAVI